MHKLVLFDKDGTLINPKSGERFVQSPEDQILRPGVEAKLARIHAAGTKMAIVSNQGGVACGHKTLKEACDEMEYAMRLTGIMAGSFSPSHPDGEEMDMARISIYSSSHVDNPDVLDEDGIECRKPGPGMLLWSMNVFAMEASQTLFVGDRPEDERAAANAGVDFEWADNYFSAE